MLSTSTPNRGDMHRFLVSLLSLLLFFALALSAQAFEKGEDAPDFTLPNLEGEEVSLSNYQGQVVILKLATTWCPTCKQQSAAIAEIDSWLAENNVVFLDVFVQDSKEMVEKYTANYDYANTYHPLLDDGQAHGAYNVYLIPRMIIVDQNQKIAHDNSLMQEREIKDVIGKLVAE